MKKRILQVSCGGLGRGGISTVIFSIVEPLKNEFEFDCVVFKKKCEREILFEKIGNLYRINTYNNDGKFRILELLIRPLVLYAGIKRICKNSSYDAIHCHNLNDIGVCLLAAKHAGVKIRIAHSHNTSSSRKKNCFIKLQERFNRLLIKASATECISCSDAAGNSYFREIPYNVIYNSIDLKEFAPKEKKIHSDTVFINVGRYTYQKNQEFVIHIFNIIKKHIKESKLYLVGYGEDQEKLSNMIKLYNLEDSVLLVPGNRVDVKEFYDKSDYMIFPSRYEGFGIALLEAQAKLIPCFVSEAVQKEVDVGLLEYISLNNSPEFWAKYILDYIKNGKLVDEDMVNKNLKRYSIDSIKECYARIYRGQV